MLISKNGSKICLAKKTFCSYTFQVVLLSIIDKLPFKTHKKQSNYLKTNKYTEIALKK